MLIDGEEKKKQDYVKAMLEKAQFSGMLFSNSPSVFFVLLPAISEVSVHGEVLSSLWLTTPTQYTATLSHFTKGWKQKLELVITC